MSQTYFAPELLVYDATLPAISADDYNEAIYTGNSNIPEAYIFGTFPSVAFWGTLYDATLPAAVFQATEADAAKPITDLPFDPVTMVPLYRVTQPYVPKYEVNDY